MQRWRKGLPIPWKVMGFAAHQVHLLLQLLIFPFCSHIYCFTFFLPRLQASFHSSRVFGMRNSIYTPPASISPYTPLKIDKFYLHPIYFFIHPISHHPMFSLEMANVSLLSILFTPNLFLYTSHITHPPCFHFSPHLSNGV